MDGNGDLVFSLRWLLRTGVLVFLALVLLHMAPSAADFYGTYFHEVVYVTGKQEIETGDLYQFDGIYFRTLRWLYKHAQLYQHVVKVSCRPYTEEEIRQAVQSDQIVEGGQQFE